MEQIGECYIDFTKVSCAFPEYNKRKEAMTKLSFVIDGQGMYLFADLIDIESIWKSWKEWYNENIKQEIT